MWQPVQVLLLAGGVGKADVPTAWVSATVMTDLREAPGFCLWLAWP